MPEQVRLSAITIPISAESTALAMASERLRHHKAMLASLGIASLQSLGPTSLKFTGNIVPQVGVTRPPRSSAELTTGEILFQGARVGRVEPGVDGDAVVFSPTGGTARLLAVAPGSSAALADAEAESAAAVSESILPIDTAYWAASWIDLAAGSVIVIQPPVRYLTLITERLTVGENVTFTYPRPWLGGPAQPPKPAKPLRALTPDGLWGVTGARGGDGLPGGPGYPGSSAPELELWLLTLEGKPIFDLGGQDGGTGDRGATAAMAGTARSAAPSSTTGSGSAVAALATAATAVKAESPGTGARAGPGAMAAACACMRPPRF